MTRPPSTKLIKFFLFALSLALLFPLCLTPSVFEVSEAREGTVVQEMLRGGNLVLPLRCSELIPSKPILFHWVSLGLAKVLGSYNEFTLRLPSALAAGGLAVATFQIAFLLAGMEIALLSAGLLLVTYLFISIGSDGRVDMLFCFLCTASFAAWLEGAVSARKSGVALKQIAKMPLLLAATFSGLAVLCKGPLGIFLPLFSCALFAFSWEHWRGLIALLRWEWLLAALIALPWYAMAAGIGSESFLLRQFFFENIDRFVGGAGIVPKPIWFYFEHIWGEAAPASLLFAFFLYRSWQRRKVQALPSGARELLLWFAGMFVFFSLSVGKRRAYLLPTAVPLVIVTTMLLNQWWNSLDVAAREKIFRRTLRSTQSLWIYLVLLFVGLSKVSPDYLPQLRALERLKGSAAALHDVFVNHGALIWSYAAILLVGAVYSLIPAIRRQSTRHLLASIFLLLAWGYLQIFTPALTAKAEARSYRQFAREIRPKIPEDAPLFLVAARHDESFDGLNFYLNHRLKLVKPMTDWIDNGYYLMRRSHPLRAPENCSRTLVSGGRLVDLPDQEILLIEVNCARLGG